MRHKKYAVARIEKIQTRHNLYAILHLIHKEFDNKFDAWRFLYSDDPEIEKIESYKMKWLYYHYDIIVEYIRNEKLWKPVSFTKEELKELRKSCPIAMAKLGLTV